MDDINTGLLDGVTDYERALMYQMLWRNCYINEVSKHVPHYTLVEIASAAEARAEELLKKEIEKKQQ